MTAQAPTCTCPQAQKEIVQPAKDEENSVTNKKPTLLDIAKQAILADKTNAAPFDLISTIQSWWVEGAKALGMSVNIFYHSTEPVQPLEMREWLLAPRTKPRLGSGTDEPCELGDVMEWNGQQYVLIGYIKTEEAFVDCAAFVPVEDVQL